MRTTVAERTVFVVEDDLSALEALLLVIRAGGLDGRGYQSAEEFLEAIEPDSRGCVITDLRLPGMSGVELIRALKAEASMLPVIVITGHADVPRAVEAMKAGALDLLEKPFARDLIMQAIRAGLAANDVAVNEGAARARAQQRLESLTARERQVLDLIMEGASNKVIAARLSISPRTVEIYRANVMSKMRAESLSELIRMTLISGAA